MLSGRCYNTTEKYLSECLLSPGREQSSQLCPSVIQSKLTSFLQEIADGPRSCEVFVKLAVASSLSFHDKNNFGGIGRVYLIINIIFRFRHGIIGSGAVVECDSRYC